MIFRSAALAALIFSFHAQAQQGRLDDVIPDLRALTSNPRIAGADRGFALVSVDGPGYQTILGAWRERGAPSGTSGSTVLVLNVDAIEPGAGALEASALEIGGLWIDTGVLQEIIDENDIGIYAQAEWPYPDTPDDTPTDTGDAACRALPVRQVGETDAEYARRVSAWLEECERP